ncbi:MAG: DUF115 domain-containing protein [Deltaproteobacteria bacterium]|nr:DUF115 domain-containing protein [Deltaproteobacteria bacterium]
MSDQQILKKNLDALGQQDREFVAFLSQQNLSQINRKRDFPAALVLPQGLHPKGLIVIIGWCGEEAFLKVTQTYPEATVLVVDNQWHDFAYSLCQGDLSESLVQKQYGFLIGVKPEALHEKLLTYFLRPGISDSLPALSCVVNPKVTKADEPYFQEFSQTLTRTIEFFWNAYIADGYQDFLIGTDYLLQNLKHIDRMSALEPYAGAFKDRLGVVVSSGPSLDQHLPWLKANQDRVLMLCADSALKKLLDQGIKPFAVCSIERIDRLANVYRGFEIPKDVSLIHLPVTPPEIADHFPGVIFPVFTNVFPFNFLPELVTKRNLASSCAHLALQMLIHFGCQRIALIGQDLAYDPKTGSSHYNGMFAYAVEHEKERERIEVMGNNGNQIQTTKIWQGFRDYFSMIIRQNPQVSVYHVIDPNYGAKIDFSEHWQPDKFEQESQNWTQETVEFDHCLGQEFIAERKKSFVKALEEWKHDTKVCFEKLSVEFEKASLSNKSEFETWWAQLPNMVGESSFAIFDAYFMAKIRRFTAAVKTLWDEEEFRAYWPAFKEEACRSMKELIAVLYP